MREPWGVWSLTELADYELIIIIIIIIVIIGSWRHLDSEIQCANDSTESGSQDLLDLV